LLVVCLAAAVALCSSLPVRAIPIPVGGAVVNPVIYESDNDVPTLALALEAAGGFVRGGTDEIAVMRKEQDGRYSIWRIRGRDFYAGDFDIRLSAGDTVVVAICKGVGLGNLSEKEWQAIREQRTAYLERREDGRIDVRNRGRRSGATDGEPGATDNPDDAQRLRKDH